MGGTFQQVLIFLAGHKLSTTSYQRSSDDQASTAACFPAET